MLVLDLASEQNKLDSAAFLYWLYPEVHAKSLASATIGEPNISVFLTQIKSLDAGFQCNACSANIPMKSRTSLKENLARLKEDSTRRPEGYKFLCDSCRESEMQENFARYQKEQRTSERRRSELAQMPYPEYLKTPEWNDRRKRQLRTAGYSCQVCNASKTVLDVHHRTYERRGNEHYKDLIVLCRGCHSTFHQNDKIKD